MGIFLCIKHKYYFSNNDFSQHQHDYDFVVYVIKLCLISFNKVHNGFS
ncbi:hypothetical protein HMPREF3202_01116 [Prevotella bivia]|uniref:Uncharacterized protein n=1 Tax=Prevotella bivia TaxID=28125 RepID=A0A137SYC5_9BACT|nr:hypothetical protein HMPREF3202_01116 [Prevotella bivia]